jgi:hypothetical protein
MLITDDGRKTETCSKFIVYGVSIKIIVLTDPNSNKKQNQVIITYIDLWYAQFFIGEEVKPCYV